MEMNMLEQIRIYVWKQRLNTQAKANIMAMVTELQRELDFQTDVVNQMRSHIQSLTELDVSCQTRIEDKKWKNRDGVEYE